MKKTMKILTIIVSILSSFSICSIKIAISQENQDYHYIQYKSDFFSLYFSNGTYYGNEDYDLFLTIEIIKNNNIENFSLKLHLFDHKNNKGALTIFRNYFYNELERALYNNSGKIGIVPIFIEENHQNNAKVLLAEFNNETLIGTYQKEEGDFIISDKLYSYDTVLTDQVNYTEYFYSDIKNILIYWSLGNKYDITLHNLLDITYFYGNIFLVSTNYDLKSKLILEPILPLIIITVLFITVFVSMFFFVRRGLKRKIKNNKKNKKLYRKYI